MQRFVTLLQTIFLAKKGRPVALVILLWLTLMSIVSEWQVSRATRAAEGSLMRVLDDALHGMATPMTMARQALFDNYQRMAPRVRVQSPVTIVEIDEQSLRTLGQWPWPRNRMASLIKAINAYNPAAIGLDIYMPEPDATSPQTWSSELPIEHKALARQISKLPNHDTLLAEQLRAAPTVLGAAGFDFETYGTESGLRTMPIVAEGGDPLPFVRQYPYVLASIPELQHAAKGQAMLSVSADDTVVRRMPLLMAVGEHVVPSLGMELLRVATDDPALRVRVGSRGIESVAVADLMVPTQAQGDIWLHFARWQGSVSRQVSAADVLAGNVDVDELAGKLVLVGLTGAGLTDQRMTALGEVVPGIEIQAQLIESLFDGRMLLRPWWIKWIEVAILLALGAAMIVLVPMSRGRFAKVVTTIPRATTWIVLAMNASFIAVGHLVFHQTGVLFDAAVLFVGFSGVLGSLVSSLLVELSRENERLAKEQQRLREAAHLVSGKIMHFLEHARPTPDQARVQRMADCARVLATSLAGKPEFASELSAEVCEVLPRIIALRDLGMMPLAGEAVSGQATLTDDQQRWMRNHTRVGGMAVETATQALQLDAAGESDDARCLLQITRDVAHFHHERWDGAGYPDGLAGEAIPLTARIAAVVDVYEALTSERPHRPALSHSDAVAAIVAGAGSQFDPRVVEAFQEVAGVFNLIASGGFPQPVAA